VPSLKSLRLRINTVKSTQKITKAMKMVAASKLRRAQERAEAARPYAERMERLIVSLAAGQAEPETAPRLLLGTGRGDTHLLLVATAERGLCGPFNSSIVRLARRRAEELKADGKNVKILCIGKKGRDQLKRDFASSIVDTIDMSRVRQVGFADAAAIGQRVLAMFEDGAFDVCTVFYNRFRSVMSQVPTENQIIPIKLARAGAEPAGPDLGGAIYEYEPDEEEILAALLLRNLSVQIFRALLENAASEQGARMTAMDSATRNAGDMIQRLTLNYNRTRQAAITKELIEIISGAETT
jgi:F-type H+-transporting ATPase subunit gamma